MELPQYSARPRKARALVPELIKLASLGLVFYVGISINLSLLQITVSLSINIIMLLAIFTMVALQLLLTYLNLSKTAYEFYLDRIDVKGKKPRSLHYYDVHDMKITKGFLDKIYNTGTVMINPKFKLSNVEKPEELLNYLRGMVAYGQGGQQYLSSP